MHTLSRAEETAQRFSLGTTCPIVEANGLRFLTDTAETVSLPVYPYHEEATDILDVALRIVAERRRSFSLCIDAFCGGGHSGLPMLHAKVAKYLVGYDINPRAIRFARANASFNGFANAQFYTKDIREGGLEYRPANTLWIANAPFALQPLGITLDPMRDGGRNGLELFEPFLQKTLRVAQPGDVLCGVLMSLINGDATSIEADRLLERHRETYGYRLETQLLSDQLIWRGHNGKKEQQNPMPLDLIYTKANPQNHDEVQLWQEAAAQYRAAGWTRLGYYSFAIYR